jgi:hypothetical protein
LKINLNSEISSFSIKKLTELKSKIGLELFNKVMYVKSQGLGCEDNPTQNIQSKKSGGAHVEIIYLDLP